MPGSYQPDSGSTDCIAASPGILYPIMPQPDNRMSLWHIPMGHRPTDCLDSPAGQYSAESGFRQLRIVTQVHTNQIQVNHRVRSR